MVIFDDGDAMAEPFALERVEEAEENEVDKDSTFQVTIRPIIKRLQHVALFFSATTAGAGAAAAIVSFDAAIVEIEVHVGSISIIFIVATTTLIDVVAVVHQKLCAGKSLCFRPRSTIVNNLVVARLPFVKTMTETHGTA